MHFYLSEEFLKKTCLGLSIIGVLSLCTYRDAELFNFNDEAAITEASAIAFRNYKGEEPEKIIDYARRSLEMIIMIDQKNHSERNFIEKFSDDKKHQALSSLSLSLSKAESKILSEGYEPSFVNLDKEFSEIKKGYENLFFSFSGIDRNLAWQLGIVSLSLASISLAYLYIQDNSKKR